MPTATHPKPAGRCRHRADHAGPRQAPRRRRPPARQRPPRPQPRSPRRPHPRHHRRHLRHRPPHLAVGRSGLPHASPSASSPGTSSSGSSTRSGPPITKFKPGQRVSAEGHMCSHTDYMARTGDAHIAADTQIFGIDRDGCFADYICVPEENVWPVHPDIPDKFAATFDPRQRRPHRHGSRREARRTCSSRAWASSG
ncbi:MAG: alcohol dehydrogenase catalytic domain-containing protein [Phycisphaerales bacterium]